jgi:glutamate dehydrogenase
MKDTTRILNTEESGYAANVFAEKESQMLQVADNLEKLGFLPKELVKNEVEWFYR